MSNTMTVYNRIKLVIPDHAVSAEVQLLQQVAQRMVGEHAVCFWRQRLPAERNQWRIGNVVMHKLA